MTLPEHTILGAGCLVQAKDSVGNVSRVTEQDNTAHRDVNHLGTGWPTRRFTPDSVAAGPGLAAPPHAYEGSARALERRRPSSKRCAKMCI